MYYLNIIVPILKIKNCLKQKSLGIDRRTAINYVWGLEKMGLWKLCTEKERSGCIEYPHLKYLNLDMQDFMKF